MRGTPKPIRAIDEDGLVVETYQSLTQAATANAMSQDSMAKLCKSGAMHEESGLRFEVHTDDDPPPEKKPEAELAWPPPGKKTKLVGPSLPPPEEKPDPAAAVRQADNSVVVWIRRETASAVIQARLDELEDEVLQLREMLRAANDETTTKLVMELS